MLTHQEARTIAQEELKSIPVIGDDGGLTIVDSATIEKPYVWIFFYNSKRYIETGNIKDALGGNAPLFISKLNGHIFTFSTGLSIEKMIDEYEEQEKAWELTLTENIYADTAKLLDMKRTLGLSNNDIADHKRSHTVVLDKGSATRLSSVQKALSDKNIRTRLIERNLS